PTQWRRLKGGGIIVQQGFAFQARYTTCKIPVWLLETGFQGRFDGAARESTHRPNGEQPNFRDSTTYRCSKWSCIAAIVSSRLEFSCFRALLLQFFVELANKRLADHH